MPLTTRKQRKTSGSKNYYIEVWMGGKWKLLHTERLHKDALAWVRERSGEEVYPVRIVRVTRVVVFEESK